MKGRFKLFKNNRYVYKNKELNNILILTVGKSYKGLSNFYYNKRFSEIIPNLNKSSVLKSLKGYSIISHKRKAFYSWFQLNRFDIKKLATHRSIVGLRGFTW